MIKGVLLAMLLFFGISAIFELIWNVEMTYLFQLLNIRYIESLTMVFSMFIVIGILSGLAFWLFATKAEKELENIRSKMTH